MLNTVRENIERLLNIYETATGFSTDFYSNKVQLHPMAIAKYLLTLSSLYRSSLLSYENFCKKVNMPCEQLDSTKIQDDQYIFWGLNFSYKSLDEDEKYLITTSLVVQSLFEAKEICKDNKLLMSLAEQSIKSLEYWFENKVVIKEPFNISVPVYSDNIKEPIFNAIAYSCSIINLYSNNTLLKDLAISIMRKLYELAIRGVGWKYSMCNKTIDLLHTSYIINSYFTFDNYRTNKQIVEFLSMINNFNFGTYFIDKIILRTDFNELNSDLFRLYDEKFILEYYTKPARMWSVGELLVALSNIVTFSTDLKIVRFVRKYLSRMFTMDFNQENEYFRHTMHYAHGLAKILEALRKQK